MQRRWVAVLGTLALLLASPEVCWAADDVPNPFKGAVDLSIWTVVVFLLLLAVLGKMAWKPLMEGLAKRERDIKAAAEEAKAARDEAARLKSELQAERNQAAAQIREIMDKARRDAEQVRDEVVAQGRAELVAERDRLHREIKVATDQALQDVYRNAAQVASLISAKAIRRNLSVEDHRALVDEALADLRGAAEERKRVLSSVG